MLLSQVPVPFLPLHRFHPNARVTIMPMVPSLPLHRISPGATYTTSRRQRCNLPTSKSMPTYPTPPPCYIYFCERHLHTLAESCDLLSNFVSLTSKSN